MKHSFTLMISTAFITFFLLCFVIYLPVTASKFHYSAAGSSDMVYSENELMSWFKKHPDGGEVALGSNINTGRYLSLNASSPITIYMNGYGIEVLSPTDISGPVTLISVDNPVPVFTITPNTSISFTKDVKINAVNSCALYFKNHANTDLPDSYSSSIYAGFFSISVSGPKGIGIKCNGGLSLESLNIRLEKGACGIEALGNISLFLTGIIGNGIPLRTSQEVSLDCCGISDVPPNARVIKRTVTLANTIAAYLMSPGTKDELLSVLPSLLPFTFQSDSPSISERTSLLPVSWNTENIDSKTPGKYEVTTYPEAFPILGLDLSFPQINRSVLVIQPEKFYLYSASSETNNVRLYFYNTPEYNSSIKLYYSADAGSTWRAFENFLFVYPNVLHLETPLDTNLSYLFQADLLVDGITTRTNILKVEFAPDGQMTPQITDGDRDGSDRGDQLIPPPNSGIDPPDDPSHPTETSSSLNLPSFTEKETDSPKDTPASKSTNSHYDNISENNNQTEMAECEYSDSENRSEDADNNQKNSTTPKSAKSQVAKTPETEPSASAKTTDKDKKESFIQETSPVLKANKSTDSVKSSIAKPMPKEKSGQVPLKLVLLCSSVMLVCLALYWRSK